jgi:hypothetical protein
MKPSINSITFNISEYANKKEILATFQSVFKFDIAPTNYDSLFDSLHSLDTESVVYRTYQEKVLKVPAKENANKKIYWDVFIHFIPAQKPIQKASSLSASTSLDILNKKARSETLHSQKSDAENRSISEQYPDSHPHLCVSEDVISLKTLLAHVSRELRKQKSHIRIHIS